MHNPNKPGLGRRQDELSYLRRLMMSVVPAHETALAVVASRGRRRLAVFPASTKDARRGLAPVGRRKSRHFTGYTGSIEMAKDCAPGARSNVPRITSNTGEAGKKV